METEKRLIDAMQLVTKLSKTVLGVKSARKVYDEVLRCIAEAPTIDTVEVVHGQWITSDYNMDCECSICGGTFEWWEADEVHFCPNCGAEMDLKGE